MVRLESINSDHGFSGTAPMNLFRSNLHAFVFSSRASCAARQQRCLFSLPDFSSFSPLGPSEQTHHERKIFPCVHPGIIRLKLTMSCRYKQSDLYAVVSDVAAYPGFIPYCTQTRILRSEEVDGSTLMDAEMTVGFKSFEESYVSKVTCTPYVSVEVRVMHTFLAV